MRGGKDVVLLRNALSLQRKGMVDAADQRKRAFRAQSRVRRAEHTSWRRGCSLPLPARFRCWAQLTPANFQAAEDRQYPHAKQSGRSTSSAPRAAAAAIHRSAACTLATAPGTVSERQHGKTQSMTRAIATCRLVSTSPSTLAICTAATHSFRHALACVSASAMLRRALPQQL